MAASVLDFSWMDAVAPVAGNGVLFLAEGLFTYLEQADIHRLVLELERRFPGAELVFDAASPWVIAAHRLAAAGPARKVAALARWGLKNGKELESWGTGIRLLHESSMGFRQSPATWSLSSRRRGRIRATANTHGS